MRYLIVGFFLLLQDGGDHAGQPATCNNHFKTAHKCECQRAKLCKKDQKPEEDPKCQTYCRKEACLCKDPCST
jgi:hypothetical protein